MLTLADDEGGNCRSGAAFSSTSDDFLERDSSDFTCFDTRCFEGGNAIGCCCACRERCWCSLLFENGGFTTSAFSALILTSNGAEDVELVEAEVDAEEGGGGASSSTSDFNLFLSTGSSSFTSTDSFNGVVTDGVDDFLFMGIGGSSEIELLLLEPSWLSRK